MSDPLSSSPNAPDAFSFLITRDVSSPHLWECGSTSLLRASLPKRFPLPQQLSDRVPAVSSWRCWHRGAAKHLPGCPRVSLSPGPAAFWGVFHLWTPPLHPTAPMGRMRPLHLVWRCLQLARSLRLCSSRPGTPCACSEQGASPSTYRHVGRSRWLQERLKHLGVRLLLLPSAVVCCGAAS